MGKLPNVMLIVMDTARADHLSCYGYRRKTTPNIDAIAEQGAVYENAFSAAPWTPPSHASIFTGKYPSRHRTLGKAVRLKGENTTVSEALARAGYATFGVTGCEILGGGSGFEKGFSEYVEIKESFLRGLVKERNSVIKDFFRKIVYGPDKGTYQSIEEIKNFIKRNKARNRPFLVFANFFACHTPYDPPSPFKKRFCSGFDESALYLQELFMNRVLKRSSEKIVNSDMDFQKLKWVASGGGGFSFSAKEVPMSEAEWNIIRSWYDGELAYLDHQMGTLFNFMNENHVFDDTLLIITSDHGENFGEHGLAVHPLCLYDSLLRVPLVISCPDLILQGHRVSSLVSLVDVFPTILEVANIKDEKEKLDGKSLFPFDEKKIHDFVCAEYGALHDQGFGGLNAWSLSASTRAKLERIDKGCKSIRSEKYKYILWHDREELYNVHNDPFEQVDIASAHPKIAESMRKQLVETTDVSFFGPAQFPNANEKDRKMIERLKTLGYI